MVPWLAAWGCAAAVLAATASASAQTGPVYISGGYAAGWQQPPALPPTEPMPGVVHNLVVAAGAGLTSWFGIEGSLSVSLTEQSLTWRNKVTSDRDTTALVYFRFAPACERRMCIEGLVGTGFNVHHVESVAIERCVTSPFFPGCRPVTGEAPPTTNEPEWTLAFGADFPVTVSQHFTVAPTVRVLLIKRPEFLTTWNDRGPDNGDGFVPTVGVSLTWRTSAKRR